MNAVLRKQLIRIGDNQESYNQLENKIGETIEKFGHKKREEKTGDKSREETLEIIQKKHKPMTKTCKSNREKVEIRELQKLVRRKVREDIRRYDESKIVNIIEDIWSTRKVKKELSVGRTMINKIKDKNGKLVKDRKRILQNIRKGFE